MDTNLTRKSDFEGFHYISIPEVDIKFNQAIRKRKPSWRQVRFRIMKKDELLNNLSDLKMKSKLLKNQSNRHRTITGSPTKRVVNDNCCNYSTKFTNCSIEGKLDWRTE